MAATLIIPEGARPAVRTLTSDAIFALSGLVAQRRAGLRCTPASCPWTRSVHESGHAIAAELLGLVNVWRVTIEPDPEARVQKSGFSAGATWTGRALPSPNWTPPRGRRSETDLHKAVYSAYALSLSEPESDWRTILRIARRLRTEAAVLVDRHWRTILAVANVLLCEKTIEGARVREIVAARNLLIEREVQSE